MFDKIVLAVDGSEPSNRAVAVAEDIAGKLGAEVIVVHVKEREPSRAGVFPLETSEEASDIVDQAVRQLKDAGVSARGELFGSIYGRAARVILEAADEQGAGLLIMGSRGLSDLAGLVLGSVTHKVLHLAHCPVLVVR